MSNVKIQEKPQIMRGELHIEAYRHGKLVEERYIHNLITTLGKEHFADQLSSTPAQSAISAMAIGTGSGQDAADTTLAVENARSSLSGRVKGSGGSANAVIYTATFTEGQGTGTITEAGLFNALTDGVMVCYTSFTAIVKSADMTLNITWTVSFT